MERCMFGFLLLIALVNFVTPLLWKYEYNGHEYFITQSTSDDDYTWYAARDACMQEGGDLVTIETDDEDRWISGTYPPFYGNLWIGLNCLRDKKTWEWADMKTSSIDEWISSEPRDNEFCAYRSSRTSSYWYSENCAEHKGFICKRKKGSVTPKTTVPTEAVGGYCPAGWVNTGTNRCYKAFGPLDKNIRWAAAQELCQNLDYVGANIACANTQEEVSMLSIIASQFSIGVELWIGIFRSYYSNQVWKWADNTPVTITNFHRGYSTYDDGCGFTSSLLDPSGSWDADGTCTYAKNAYICQILKDPENIIPTPAPTQPNSCKNGYTPLGENCYRVFADKRSFDESVRACANDGADLVDIHGGGENSVTQYLLFTSNVDMAWIGFKFNTEKNDYEWTNNWYVNYVNWGPNQPSRASDLAGCVGLQKGDGMWYDTICSEQLPFVCKTTTSPPVTEPPERPGRCPSREWFPIGGHCYLACATGCDTLWLDQEESCRKAFKGAKMASIHDDVTNHKVTQALYDDYSYGDAWLALFKSAADLKWRWLDGSTLQYTNWAPNQPPSDPSSEEHCAYLSLDTNSRGQWFASKCDVSRRGKLCKVPKIENPPTPTPINGTCPSELWSQFGDKCFLFRPDEFATWNVAQQHCIMEGGSNASLAIIRSWPENDFVHIGLLSATHLPESRNCWIGMAKKAAEYPFEWIDGKNLSLGFTHWGPGQPSAVVNKLCGEINIETSMWQSQVCSTYAGYACQVPVVPYASGTPAPPGGPDAGVVVGIVFGVIAAVLLGLIIGFIIYSHVKGNPIINFTRFTNPSSNPGFEPPKLPEEEA